MNGKIIAIIAVVIVVGAAGGGAYYFLKDKNKDPNSDYTLLDSNDKIVAGLTIKQTSDEYSAKYVVETVADGKVTYSIDSNGEGVSPDSLSRYLPGGDGVWLLDYVNETDPQFQITHEGNVYTINGGFSYPSIGATYKYNNLKITYNGATVTDVSGGLYYEMKTSDLTTKNTTSLSTKDGVLTMDYKTESAGKATVNVADFYGETMSDYDAGDFAGATVTEKSGKYGNVDCTVYTINGTVASPLGPQVYKDVNLYVYKGFIIHGDGTVDDKYYKQNVSIYV